MVDSSDLALDQIQGNVLAGFNKDFQSLLFVAFTDSGLARTWLGEVAGEVATTQEVVKFNDLFKMVHSRRGHASDVVQATWMNVAFSSAGLKALGVPDASVAQFPPAFQEGLRAHATDLGHTNESAPENWRPAFRSDAVHAVMIVASDDPDDLDRAIERFMEGMGARGISVLDRFDGSVRQDEKGHEHFGFKDGVSQPVVLGFSETPGGAPADDSVFGPIQPGEFIIGYPTEAAAQTEPPPTPPSQYGQPPPPPPSPPAPGPGPISSSAGPAWTKDGSFLVIERLLQRVAQFRSDTAQKAADTGFTDADLFRAKLVGRHRSGCPMEQVAGMPDTTIQDLGLTDPSVLADDKVNAFTYAADPDGTIVPRAAHVRKVNPRDQTVPGPTAVRAHRILRRGIPFGESYRETAPAGSAAHADAERGLIFACYQADIQRQFEFIQESWVNNPGFPNANDGVDVLISETPGPFELPGATTSPSPIGGWLRMTAGAYFFQPSIAALQALAAGNG